MKKLITIGLSILLPMAFNSLQAQEFTISQKKQNAIDAMLDDAQSKGLSGYVLVNVNGQRVISRETGKQDVEANLANTTDTVFDFGSNTKQFTAAAIMKLSEAGKLALKQQLSDFFEDVSDEKSAITIHQLLTHTAGFEESSGRGLNKLSKFDFLKQVLTSPLAYDVGERFEYSNIGYSVLAAIIEKVTGLSYEAYLQQALFAPIKMYNTGYTTPKWQLDKVATGYYRGFKNFGTMIERYQENGVTWNLMGNGGIQTTASDFAIWMNALQSGMVLSKDSLKLMLHPHANYSESKWSYGYGWTNTLTDKDVLLAGHTGSNGLYWSAIYWVPQFKLSIFFASNAQMPSTELVAREIRNILLKDEYLPKPIPHDAYWEVSNFVSNASEVNVKALFSYLEDNRISITNEKVLNRVGSWASEQGKSQWAIALLEKNVLLYPNDGNLYDSLAEAYMMNGDAVNAKKSFQKALELAPNKNCNWCENSKLQLAKLNS